MGNILTFPDRYGTADDPQFLQDGDDILQFDRLGHDTQSRVCTFSPPTRVTRSDMQDPPTKDWGNQELAHLFRVKRILDLAGVPNSIDRGLTDEGDPWFLFCDAKGEVFIHLCRLDGIYLLDSPNIKTPLRGADFNALIDEFVDRKTRGTGGPDQPGDGNSHRVVHLNRDGKVFIHPTTMLAALVWTLLLDFEDLVMVLPARDDDAVDETDTSISLPEGWDQDSHSVTEHDLPAAIRQAECGEPDHALASGLTAQASNILTDFNEEKLNQNTNAIGLSIIAISLGFMSRIDTSDIHETAMDSFLALLTDSSADHEHTDNHGNIGFDTDQIQDFASNLANILGSFDLLDHYFADADADDQPEAKLVGSAEKDLINTSSSTAYSATQGQDKSGPPAGMEEIALDVVTSNHQPKLLPAAEYFFEERSGYEADHVSQALVYDVIKSLGSDVKEYVINDIRVGATFDVSQDKFEQSSTLIFTSKPEAEDTSHAQEREDFNKPSLDFILYFMQENDDFEVMVVGDETILFDMDALDVAAEDRLIMSWSLSNGDVISTVGLRSDYDTFDLIA